MLAFIKGFYFSRITMTDIFLQDDLKNLFQGKKVVFLGDSNIRAYYKDMLCLYHGSDMIDERTLRAKMEKAVYNDKLLKHGEKTNGRHYYEEREFQSKSHHIAFYFLTRIYNDYVDNVLVKITKNKKPDVIIINSCLWDMCRRGPNGVEEFKVNLLLLMEKFKEFLGEDCLVIWMTTPPLSSKLTGGVFLVQLDFLKYCMRFHVMEANTYAKEVLVKYGYDVLDVHYHLCMQIQRRCKDGIHWKSMAVRYITNLLLTHISLAWGVPIPHRSESLPMQTSLEEQKSNDEGTDIPMQGLSTANTSVQKRACGNNNNRKKIKARRRLACLTQKPKVFERQSVWIETSPWQAQASQAFCNAPSQEVFRAPLLEVPRAPSQAVFGAPLQKYCGVPPFLQQTHARAQEFACSQEFGRSQPHEIYYPSHDTVQRELCNPWPNIYPIYNQWKDVDYRFDRNYTSFDT